MASLRAPLCISRRDDLRHLAAGLLDLVPFGAASDRRGVLRGRPDHRGRSSAPRYRFTYLNNEYSIAEALLWLGIYLAINLQLSSVDLLGQWWGRRWTTTEFSRPFYWATWVLTWCLPPVVLARGLRREKTGSSSQWARSPPILTLVTNKPYLGWPRHTWDPMLLGALLIGVALFIRRWLAKGPGGIRHGFTAQRLSGKDKPWMSAGATAIGLVSPNVITPTQQTGSPDVHFGGGDSGGAGASSDF